MFSFALRAVDTNSRVCSTRMPLRTLSRIRWSPLSGPISSIRQPASFISFIRSKSAQSTRELHDHVMRRFCSRISSQIFRNRPRSVVSVSSSKKISLIGYRSKSSTISRTTRSGEQ